MYFFGTLVRLHRAGEGAPYTGLEPAGTVDPAVAAADKSVENGAVEHLVRDITKEVARGIQKRFDEALAKKKYAEESVEAGREFIEAYVEFVHYVERLYEIAAGKSSGHAHAETPHGGSQ